MMVWACFSNGKPGPLIVCDSGAVNADAYLKILLDEVGEFITELLTPEEDSDTIRVATDDAFLFMHDNTPCHTAKKVTQFLKLRGIPIRMPIGGLYCGEVSARRRLVFFCVQNTGSFEAHSREGLPIAERVKSGGAGRL